MKLSETFEWHTAYILYAFGIVFFLLRIMATANGDWDEMTQEEGWKKAIGILQPMIELLIVVSFISVIVPRWVSKLRNTKLIDIVTIGCTIASVVLLMVMVPTITGEPLDVSETRTYTAIAFISVIIVVYLISYLYGKKKKKEEGDKEEEGDNDESDNFWN